MPDNIVEILVKFGLDKSQAQQANAEIARLKDSTTEAGKEGVKAADNHTQSLLKNRQALRLLSHQFGEFGILLRNVFNLPALGIGLVALGIGKLADVWKKWQKSIEESVLAMQNLDQVKLSAAAQQVQSLTSDMRGLKSAIQDAGRETDVLKESFDTANASRKAAGLPPVGSEEEIRQRLAAQPDLAQRAAEAVAAAANAKASPNKALAQARLDEALQKIADLDKEAGSSKWSKLGVAYTGVEDMFRQTQAELEKAKNDPSSTPAVISDRQKEANKAAEIYQTYRGYQGQRESSLKFINKITGEQAEAERTAASAQGAAVANSARITQLQREGRVDEGDTLGAGASGALAQAGDISRRFLSGGKISDAEREFVTTIGSVGSGQSVNFQTAARVLASAQNNQKTQEAFLARILAVLEQTGGVNQGLDRRLSAIESRINALPPQP